MKKIIFTIAPLLYGTLCFCQVNLPEGIIELPPNARKITIEQANDHVLNKFRNNQFVSSSLNSRKKGYFFQIDNILVTLFSSKIEEGAKIDVAQNKIGMDGIMNVNKTYSSEVRRIGDDSVLITNAYITDNVEAYRFYLYKADHTKRINGVLEFNREDKAKAKNILEHIFSHIKFKE